MSPLIPMALFLGCSVAGTLVFVALLFLALRQRSKRTQDLRSGAESFDLRFVGEDESHLASLGAFPLFEGDKPHLWNLQTGDKDGFAVSIFDYSRDVDPEVLKHTVAVLRSPSLRLPSFALHGDRIFGRIGAFFGRTNIIPSHMSLSRRYHLAAEDTDGARAMLTPDVVRLLEARQDFMIEGHDGGLLVGALRECSSKECALLLADALELARHLDAASRARGQAPPV